MVGSAFPVASNKLAEGRRSWTAWLPFALAKCSGWCWTGGRQPVGADRSVPNRRSNPQGRRPPTAGRCEPKSFLSLPACFISIGERGTQTRPCLASCARSGSLCAPAKSLLVDWTRNRGRIADGLICCGQKRWLVALPSAVGGAGVESESAAQQAVGRRSDLPIVVR